MAAFTGIVITGASSGIGEALALDYAAPGVLLALTGRDETRLGRVAAACRAKGATVEAEPIDVLERERLAAWLEGLDDRRPLDLVVANAGISIDKDNASVGDFSVIRHTMDVNFAGVLNTLEPLLPRFRARRHGQIGLMSSLAAFIGLPYSPAYSASKAAVRVWGESMRLILAKDRIGVTVICPGFVSTPLTGDAAFPMPFMMAVDDASRIIRNGLERNRARIAFPLGLKAAIWLGSSLPASWTARLLGR